MMVVWGRSAEVLHICIDNYDDQFLITPKITVDGASIGWICYEYD